MKKYKIFIYLLISTSLLSIKNTAYSDENLNNNLKSRTYAIPFMLTPSLNKPSNNKLMSYGKYSRRGIEFGWSTLEQILKNIRRPYINYDTKYSLYIGDTQNIKKYYVKDNLLDTLRPPTIKIPDIDTIRIIPNIPSIPYIPYIPSVNHGYIPNPTFGGFSRKNSKILAKGYIKHFVYKLELPSDKPFIVTLVTWLKNKNGTYKKYSTTKKEYKFFIGAKMEEFSFVDDSTVGKFQWSSNKSDQITLNIGTKSGKSDLYTKTFKRKNGRITTSIEVRNLYNRGKDIHVELSSSKDNITTIKNYSYKTKRDNIATYRNCSGQKQYAGSHRKFLNLKLTSEYSDINNYLMMQAAAKTYPRQMKGLGAGQSRSDFECKAEVLYNHWGFSKVTFYNHILDGTNAIIVSNDDVVVIAIRGTEEPLPSVSEAVDSDIRDVLLSASKFTVPFFGKVHLGYNSAGKNLSDHLINTSAHQHDFANKKIFITGHSLGGAVAIMTNHHLKSHYSTMASYIFASPEVGDEEFTKNLLGESSPYYMTINYRDPVPYAQRKPTVLPGITGSWYAASLEASRHTTFFRRNHSALSFPSHIFPGVLVSDRITSENGGWWKQPYILGSIPNLLTTDEWHFHHVNFYLASAYKKLGSFDELSWTKIKPEFEAGNMCIKNGRNAQKIHIGWNGDQERILSDRQSTSFTRCQ